MKLLTDLTLMKDNSILEIMIVLEVTAIKSLKVSTCYCLAFRCPQRYHTSHQHQSPEVNGIIKVVNKWLGVNGGSIII